MAPLALGCSLVNDYSIFETPDAAPPNDDAGMDAEVRCMSDDDCGIGSVCIDGVCRGCDTDGDGFPRDLEGCPTDRPVDCDDTSDTIYPGALPICRDGITQSCDGAFMGLPLAEIGAGPALDLGPVGTLTAPRIRSLSVLLSPPAILAPNGGRAVAIVHEDGGVARAVAFELDGTVTSTIDLRTAIAPLGPMPAALDGSALKRLDTTEYLAVTGDWGTASARAFYDLSTPRQLTQQQNAAGSYRAPNAIVRRLGIAAQAYPQWTTMTQIANVNVFAADGTSTEAADARVDMVVPQWIAGDGSLVMGNLMGGVYLFGAHDAAIPAPGPIPTFAAFGETPERGTLVELAGARIVGVIPRAGGMTTFTMDGATGQAMPALASFAPTDVDSAPRRLFAGVRTSDASAAIAFAESGPTGDIVRTAGLTDTGAWIEPTTTPVFAAGDFGAPIMGIEDVAITAEITSSGFMTLFAAVLQLNGEPHLVVRQIVGCTDDTACDGQTCEAVGVGCGYADDGCGRTIECRCPASTDECTTNACRNRMCAAIPVPNGTECDDGDPGTAESFCSGGVCAAPAGGVDVHLIIDTTGSNWTDGWVPGRPIIETRCVDGLLALSRVNVGVYYVGEFMAMPYGSPGDRPFEGGIEPTNDAAAIRAELAAATMFMGNDLPDALLEPLSALSGGVPHPQGLALTCSAGREPVGCWRPGTRHVIVFFTDSPIHNGPTTTGPVFMPYDPTIVAGTATWDNVRAQLMASGTIVIFLDAVGQPPGPEQWDRMLMELGQPATDRIDASPANLPFACDALVARVAAL